MGKSKEKEVTAILDRQATHGQFEIQGHRADDIRTAMGVYFSDNLVGYQRTALNMIAEKLSRIIEGDPNYEDHWVDIAGYCERVLEVIRGRNGAE